MEPKIVHLRERDCAQSALTVLYVGTASAGGGKVVRLCVQGQALMCKDAKSKELDEMSLGICGSSWETPWSTRPDLLKHSSSLVNCCVPAKPERGQRRGGQGAAHLTRKAPCRRAPAGDSSAFAGSTPAR